MERHTDWLIFGSGLSALVLAERLGNAGKEVVLINPSRSWGGIFRGIGINGELYDAGMTNFEFDLFGEPADDLDCYSPDCRADVGRYVHFVQSYLSRFVQTAPLPTPRMCFNGQLVDDLIISNRFDVLRTLPAEVKRKICSELEEILARPNPLHPRTKNEPGSPLGSTPFEQVSRANHGNTFHELFIEPIFGKILGIPTREIEGVFHRNGWAPLFYPESLLSQFTAAPQALKPTIFSYPDDPHFGAFIGRIASAVQALPSVTVIEGIKEVEVDAAASTLRVGERSFSFNRLAWGADLTQLLGPDGALQAPGRRANLDLFFLRVEAEGLAHRFAVLIDPEAGSPFYRITDQSVCAGEQGPEHKIILECNSSNWDEKSKYRNQRWEAALRRYGIDPSAVLSCERRTFNGALGIPSQTQMEQFNQRRECIVQTFSQVTLIGAASGYVSVTLNDHIIQALKIAHREGAL
jgi:hypothetical protein